MGIFNTGYNLKEGRNIAIDTEFPERVECITWDRAVTDLHQAMANVPTDELAFLVSALQHGIVDGSTMYMEEGCSCFVGLIVDHSNLSCLDRDEPFDCFSANYGEVEVMSPFQQWLCLVKPKDTPSNNLVAKAFETELQAMIASRK